MGNRHPTRPRRGAAAWAGTLALALALGWSAGGAFAQNAEDEEDAPLDTKLFRQFLKDLGLRRDGQEIDYRARAPLVVPPSRNLPPPQSETAVTGSIPAWPNDPDVKKRKADVVAKKKVPKTAAETMDLEGRPLSRTELENGRVPAGTPTSVSQTPEEAARPMKPSELGAKSLFSGMFSTFNDKGETATFTGEPVRENLTAPPAGYQTPSPNQPYGIAPKKNEGKALSAEERAAGPAR
jgi:hypothetical protein